MRVSVSSLLGAAAFGTLLLAASPALAQLDEPSPCCAKVCNGTTSTRCDQLTLTGSGELVAGCLEVQPIACVGGQVLDTSPPQLTEACTCASVPGLIPQTCLNVSLPGPPGAATAEQCTALAVAACDDAAHVIVVQNDPDCGGTGPECETDADCSDGQVCDNGTCVCPAGTTECNDVCVDTTSDEANCGACGNACAAGETCEGGQCVAGPDCETDADCSDGQVCDDGTCVCPAGTTDCNGTCVDTSSDEANCGACGNACAAGETCEAGQCAAAPECETDADCSGGQVCVEGSCACPAGMESCNGICVDTSSDEANCGACGNACGAGEICEGGQCGGAPPAECGDEVCAENEECFEDCGEEVCEDGADNDGDGKIDCKDQDCRDGNRSGGGDDTNPGGGGNPRGFCNPGGVKKGQ